MATTKNKTDAQFKRLRQHSNHHLTCVFRDHMADQVPPAPPDFWPWAEAVVWQSYTPAQKATLIEVGYTIDLAKPTTYYKPFVDAPFNVTVGGAYDCTVQLPPRPTSTSLPIPFLSDDGKARVSSRGPGQYVSTSGLGDLWACLHTELERTPGERTVAMPPSIVAWHTAIGALSEVARNYDLAARLVDHVWRQLQQGWAPANKRISCNAYMLTVPEWVPMRLRTSSPERRTVLPAATRQRAEAHIEALLQTNARLAAALERDLVKIDMPSSMDAQQPLLPQLRELMLPPITAYRLAGKDVAKSL